MTETVHNGWTLHFRPNVHMYCHELTAAKGDHKLQVSCEDMPIGGVGIWPYSLELDSTTYADLLVALRSWARTIGSDYRLYTTRGDFESGPENLARAAQQWFYPKDFDTASMFRNTA